MNDQPFFHARFFGASALRSTPSSYFLNSYRFVQFTKLFQFLERLFEKGPGFFVFSLFDETPGLVERADECDGG